MRLTYRLVGRAIFAEANAVVCKDINNSEVAQRGETHSAQHVAAKVEKGRTEGDQAAMRRDAVADPAQQKKKTHKRGKP